VNTREAQCSGEQAQFEMGRRKRGWEGGEQFLETTVSKGGKKFKKNRASTNIGLKEAYLSLGMAGSLGGSGGEGRIPKLA